MPDSDNLPRVRIPLEGETDDVPMWLQIMIDDLGPQLVLKVANQTERDTYLAAAPAGTIASASTAGALQVWIKTANDTNSWATLWRDTGKVLLAGATWPSDWTDLGSFYRIKGSWTSVVITAVYGGAAFSGSSSGSITDRLVVTVPTACRPDHTERETFLASAPGVTSLSSAGEVKVNHLYPGATMNTSTAFYATFGFPTP